MWESGDVPHHWLHAKIAMIHKSGPREAARSYRPMNVATGMYSILARLVLDTLRGPIAVTPKQDVGGATPPHHKPSACQCFYTDTGTGH